MRLLSIDFGTSNTVVALVVDGQAPRTVTFDTSPLLPSAVYVAADGSVTVGREAQRQARLDPTRYEPNPKRRIDDGEVLLGDRVVGIVDLIAAVLRTIAAEVRRQLGGAMPDEVRLTHPAQWGATRQNTLTSAARAAGLGTNLVLIPEPVAAAAQYTRLPGRTLPPGGSVAVYDLGGGTFDIAVVGRTHREFHVLAEAGLPDLGGLDFDQAVLDHVGRTASSADPARWQQIQRPTDVGSRRAARALAEDVRAAKETLSRYPQTEVALPEPFTDVHLTRTEFEGLIRPSLMRSIEVLQTTLRNAGVGADRLAGIFLVGGSSRVPLVAKLISEQLGVTPVALDQPETAVALGALLVPVHREGNRTVAYGDTPGGSGPRNAGQPPAGPGSGPHSVPSGPVPAGLPHRSGAAVSGPVAVPGSAPGPAGGPAGGARGSGPRRSVLIVAVAAVVVVAAAVVLIVVRPFSGSSADPGDDGTGTSTVTSSGQGSDTSGSGPTAGSTASPGPDDPGFGPGSVMTRGEYEFLGPAADKLINCGDNTEQFNKAVTDNSAATYASARVVRCEVGDEGEESGLFGRTLVYVLTRESPQDADKLLDTIAADRTEGKYATSDPSGTSDTSKGTLRLVAADQLKQLGTGQQGDGVSAIGWALDSQPYVGVMVGLTVASKSDLVDYYTINYKPR